MYVVKPLVTTMMTPRASEHSGHGGHASAFETMAEEEAQGPTPFQEKLHRARGVAEQDPKAVANIIKDWTGANAG